MPVSWLCLAKRPQAPEIPKKVKRKMENRGEEPLVCKAVLMLGFVCELESQDWIWQDTSMQLSRCCQHWRGASLTGWEGAVPAPAAPQATVQLAWQHLQDPKQGPGNCPEVFCGLSCSQPQAAQRSRPDGRGSTGSQPCMAAGQRPHSPQWHQCPTTGSRVDSQAASCPLAKAVPAAARGWWHLMGSQARGAP